MTTLENLMQNLMLGYLFFYSSLSKAYTVFNKKNMVVEEFIHVVFDESNDSFQK